MSRMRIGTATTAVLFILLSWWFVLTASSGLVRRDVSRGDTPLTYIAPANLAADEKVPGVIIAHGFSGSRQLMLPYAYYLAHAGYGTILLDFAGHGQNEGRLALDRRQSEGQTLLLRDVQNAFETLLVQPEIDPQRIALLGHSMGSGAVMSAGIARPEWYSAVLAISPTGAEVSATLPPNLLLQAGSLETPFVANAQDLLQRAGGTAVSPADFANGRAREFQLINGVEHISILFSGQSHASALAWLNQTWGLDFQSAYRESRMVWFGVHLLGWLVLTTAVSPLLPQATQSKMEQVAPHSGWAMWVVILLAPLLATAVLAVLGQLFDLTNLGGLLVGGTLALWFLLVGLIWLFGVWPVPTPTRLDLLWGAALFLFWLVAFGAMGHIVWLNWWLSPARLLRWPFLAVACLPWMLAVGLALAGLSGRQRLLLWLGQSVLLLVGIGLAIIAVPSIGFLILVLPALPVLLLLMSLLTLAVDRPWAYALAHAGFFAWLLLAVFPLV